MSSIEISVVVPAFNEDGNIEEIHKHLIATLSEMGIIFELIFVDDGSKDRTWELISSFSDKDERVIGIGLSRNFGHQIALVAGIEHARGNYVVTMDADLQHPTNLIPTLYKEGLNGADIVNTIRSNSSGEKGMKRATSRLFYKIANRVSEVKIQSASADFRLMNRKAIDAFMQLKEKDRFTRGLVGWMGFKQVFITFDAPKRFAGKSKYTYRRMFQFAGDGFFSFSSRPLRVSFYLGLLACVLGFGYAIYSIIQHALGNTIPGWTSLMTVVIILGGIQLLSLGIIGEYISRIFNEVKNRPLYYVQKYSSKSKEQTD